MSLRGAADAAALASLLLLGLLLGRVALAAPGALSALYRRHVREGRHERVFLSSVAFFAAFVIVRIITLAIKLGRGPFRDITEGGIHVHHLVWGIFLLLGVGYLWLIQTGTGDVGSSPWASRLTAILYGVGAALTLDEFALWLRLQDVYWTREGRESVRAVLLFGALLSSGLWGGPFFRALVREATRAFRARG